MSNLSTNRASLFPAASVGRNAGRDLLKQNSPEQLSTHPLLSQSSSATSTTNSPTPDTTSFPPPSPNPSTATTTTSTSYAVYTRKPNPASGDHPAAGSGASVTHKLQMQQLRAAAQDLGLGHDSAGWVFLEKIVAGQARSGDEGKKWKEIIALASSDKATLLLPTPALPTSIQVTPQLVKDHILFLSLASSSAASAASSTRSGGAAGTAVTASGIRGTSEADQLVLKGFVPDGTLLPKLLDPATRSTTLTALPPPPASPAPTKPSFPTFILLSPSAALPLPPSPAVPPPLPPRPRAHSSTNPSSRPAARSTFAALFGGGDRNPQPAPSLQVPSPDRPSTPDEQPPQQEPPPVVNLNGCAVDKLLRLEEIQRGITKAIEGRVKEGLGGLPSGVIDRVCNFITQYHPSPPSAALALAKRPPKKPPLPPPPPPDLSDSDVANRVVQELFVRVHTDVYNAAWAGFVKGWKGEKEVEGAEQERMEDEAEDRAMEAVEKVENVLTTELFDRLFSCAPSDTVADDSLASRIAALNMLDLSLDHLGVQVPDAEPGADAEADARRGLEEVVAACGKELQRLGGCASPADKLDVLVGAHKVIVDGLTKLPPIRLRPENPPQPSAASSPEKEGALGSPAQEKELEPVAAPANQLGVSGVDTPAAERTPRTTEKPYSSPQVVPELHLPEPSQAIGDAMASSMMATPPPPQNIDLPSPSPPSPSPAESTPLSAASSIASPRSPTLSLLQVTSPPGEREPKTAASSGADLILPLVIFSVVKSNPAQLASNLAFIQRFRAEGMMGGEASYALVNLAAAVEFLNSVDLSELGLGGSDRVIGVGDLSPLPLVTFPAEGQPDDLTSKIRGKVTAEIGELAGSANKVLSGVVDSGWGALRGLMGSSAAANTTQDCSAPASPERQPGGPPLSGRPSSMFARRASSISVASIAASVASIAAGKDRPRSSSSAAGGGQPGEKEMVTVSSRPGSIKSIREEGDGYPSDEEDSVESKEDEEEEEVVAPRAPRDSDARSIRSFASMRSTGSREDGERMTISDRLASIPVLGRFSHAASSSTSSAAPQDVSAANTPPKSSSFFSLSPTRGTTSLPPPSTSHRRATLLNPSAPSPPHPTPLAPPNKRFLECSEEDLRMGEIGALLAEYRRLAGALRDMGVFPPGEAA